MFGGGNSASGPCSLITSKVEDYQQPASNTALSAQINALYFDGEGFDKVSWSARFAQLSSPVTLDLFSEPVIGAYQRFALAAS